MRAVLCIDDVEVNLSIYRAMLAQEPDLEVLTAASAEAAIVMYEQRGEEIIAMIVDGEMGTGKTGPEFIYDIRKAGYQGYLIAASENEGMNERMMMGRGGRKGADSFTLNKRDAVKLLKAFLAKPAPSP